MNKKLRTFLGILVVLTMLLGFAACGTAPVEEVPTQSPTATPVEADIENEVIRLSTTTSVNDSGLLPYLQPIFEADTGYKLEISSAGTGAAIEKGRTGDADALLVHAKSSEETFIEEGFADERIPFMYNYFVIVGPADDPAGVRDCANASEAFNKIAEGGHSFISRGDDSGTHKAELKIWESAGLTPNGEADKWYVSAGAGMGDCLNMANEQQCYVLTDKATFLSREDNLEILLEKSDEMKNTYSMLIISPEKWPDNNQAGAQVFVDWMLSDKASEMINAYGVEEYGQQLFFTIDE